MRIGFDVTPLCGTSPTGVGVYTAQLLTHLQILLDEPPLPLVHQNNGLWHDGRVRLPARVLASPFRLNKTLWMQAILPFQVRHVGVDLCHFTNGVAPLLCSVPMVVTLHDASLWLYPQYHYLRRLLAMRPLIPWVVRRARAVITVSESARRDLIRVLGLPRSKVHVVYEAPASCFRPLPPGRWQARLRARYGLPARYVLYVGTIEPRKNLVRLIRAMALLHTNYRLDCGLVVVGPRGWKDRVVFETVARLGLTDQVRFLGYVPTEDVCALYNLADVFVFPSLYEGFGLPVLEAMACGAPVVTSRVGALAEVAGGAAALVDPRDETHIAAALARVLTDGTYAAHLRASGRARAAQFGWTRAATETVAVYRRALATG